MTWLNLDDGFYDAPELADLGLAELGLWVAGLAYCSKHLTDGFIPDTEATKLGRGRAAKRHVSALVATGKWQRTDGGVIVSDYFRYCPSRESVLNRIASRTQSGKLGGSKSAESRKSGQASASTQSKQVLEAQSEVCLPRARDPILSDPILSNPDPPKPPEGVSEAAREETVSDTEPSPEPEPTREDDYRKAYEAGIIAGRGGTYAMPRNQAGELHQAILAHARGGKTGNPLRGSRLLEWIRLLALDFAVWLKAQVESNPNALSWYSGYGPRGFLKWLNEQ